MVVHGRGSLRGGEVTLDASASSQFVSGLLLAGARFDAGRSVHHVGAPVPSLPHIEMTVAMLRDARCGVTSTSPTRARRRWRVQPGPIRARDRTVEPDLSNALPFLAAAIVTGGSVTIPGWPRELHPARGTAATAPGGDGRADLMSDDGLTVPGRDRLHRAHADLRDVGELTPVLAALAALADSPVPPDRHRPPARP